MTLVEMIAKKRELGYSCEYIAKKSGIPLSTVQKIFSKATTVPRRTTMEALLKVFEPENRTKAENELEDRNKKSLKTVKDYYALPEGANLELIDGVFYKRAEYTRVHQIIVGTLLSYFENYSEFNRSNGTPFAAETEVRFECDQGTVIKPDVLVMSDKNKKLKSGISGAPALIVEVVSKSSWYNDMVRKLIKYKKVGVREYWIVIPDYLKVIVYYFEESDIPTEYTFKDEIPVNIWNGECKVDFNFIYDKISLCKT